MKYSSTKPITPKYHEDDLQKAVAGYLDFVSSATQRFIWFHPTQEAKRSFALAAWLKSMGMKRGPADCILFCEGGRTVHIELKLAAQLTSMQEEWAEDLKRLGHPSHLVRAKTPGEAVDAIGAVLRLEGLL